MNVARIEEMIDIDNKSINDYGVPSILLMEHAGKNIFEKIKNYKRKTLFKYGINIFSGIGGNGGDGLVVARYAIQSGIKTAVYIIGDIAKAKKDFISNYKTLLSMNVVFFNINEINISMLIRKIKKRSVVLDAIYGTGLSRPIDGVAKKIIEYLNKMNVYRVSADIPSGLTNIIKNENETVFKSHATYTVGLPKDIFFKHPLCRYLGKLFICNTLFPRELLNKKSNIQYIEKKMLKEIKVKRDSFNTKREQGMLSIVAGSVNYTGAAILAALSAYRLSLGYIRLYIPISIASIIRNTLSACAPEIVIIPTGEKFFTSDNIHIVDDINKGSACLIGCGLGNEIATSEFVNSFLQKITVPTVADADALRLVNQKTLETLSENIILTPHIYEYAKISSEEANEILKEPYESLKRFSEKYKVSILLKDAVSFALIQKNIFVNYNPTPGMGKAGMGDMLAGTIASMLAKQYKIEDAVIISLYLQKITFKKCELYDSTQPSDMIKALDKSFKEIIKYIIGKNYNKTADKITKNI